MEEWYISRNGEQEGPVTPQQVKALLDSGHLDSATTLCWCEGMADWIALPDSGILAAAAPAPVAVGQITFTPYVAPQRTKAIAEAEEFTYPGFGRLAYIGWTFLITFIGYALLFAVILLAFKGSSSNSMGLAIFFGFVFVVLMVAATMYIGVKRVQNLGMSGWAVLWSLVPFMNFWIGWRMMACPAGYEHHRTLDTAGKVVTGIFIGLFVLSLVSNIIVAISQN